MELSGFKIEQSGIIDISKQKATTVKEGFAEGLNLHDIPASKTFNNPTDPNHPLNDRYAEVHIRGENGKDIVVKIDNNGFTESPNNFFSQLGISAEQLGALGNGQSGPEIARLRAEKIAELTGGTVKLASTAITEPGKYPSAFTYTREELASQGILSPKATLQAEIAKLKFLTSQ